MNWKNLLDSLIPIIGQAGVDLLAEEFKDLSEKAEEPWMRTVLNLLVDATNKYGMLGVEIVRETITKIFDNKVPKIDWANPRTASDVVAQMQKMELKSQGDVYGFLSQMGVLFGKITSAMLKGLISGI